MHREDFLALEKWHRLLAAAPAPRDAALLWLMTGCGLRVSEVAAMKVERLDGPGGYLHVVNGKGGKQRTSILPKPVLEALEAHIQGRIGGYVFEGRDLRSYLNQADPKAPGQSCRAAMLNGFSFTWTSQPSTSMWPGGDGRGRIHEDQQGEDRCPGDPALIALGVLFQQCLESTCCIAFSCYG